VAQRVLTELRKLAERAASPEASKAVEDGALWL
jgi:hypothetical protein